MSFASIRPAQPIALIIYAGGSILALIGGFRGLRLIEAASLIAVPFLFNLLLAIGADWHMAELGAVVTAHANLPFVAQVAIGRALILWFVGEAILTLINWISRQPTAAIGAHACVVCAERRGRGRYSFVRQRSAMGRSAVPGDLLFRLCVRRSPRRACGRSSIS